MRIFSPIFVSFSNLVLSIHMHGLFWRGFTYSNILCIPVVNLFACTEGLIITSLGHRGLTYAIFWLYAMSVGYGWKCIPTQHRSGLKNLHTAHVFGEPTCNCSFCIPCGVVINERAKGRWLTTLLASSRQLSCSPVQKRIKCGIAVEAGA